jgi:hypothetical protein
LTIGPSLKEATAKNKWNNKSPEEEKKEHWKKLSFE